MRILGINGNLFCERWDELPPQIPYRSYFEGSHDSSAVLLEDGEVVAAVEQERLDRIKHAGGFPIDAIRACLEMRRVALESVDLIAISYSHLAVANSLLRSHIQLSSQGGNSVEINPERFIGAAFERTFGESIALSKLRFIKHHLSHAASAFWPSGFDQAMVATLDGVGEDESGSIYVGNGIDLKIQKSFSPAQSLGWFYLYITRLIGFRLFDEYKAMGLAPYGDPKVYGGMVDEFYTLESDGRYVLHFNRIVSLAADFSIRHRSAPFLQAHMDLAAAAQSALERIAFHVLAHFQRETRARRLCFAGGVAHNCTLNGKLRSSQLFDEVFVQPASHDGGLALGAALLAYRDETGRRPSPMPHVYLGKDIGKSGQIEAECKRWSAFVEFHRSSDVATEAAGLLANGAIIGWVQGRSEFGPRALGNRSILADPRPAANKQIINAMIKKREGFRPFAPAVIEEVADQYFDIPRPISIPFMTFVVGVKEEQRAVLGAVCHVDGSARVQTVTRSANERFWSLIKQFGTLTGVPVLLNTSFNNNAEPIVDSARDAIVSFLTTELNALVIGDFILQRRIAGPEAYGSLKLRLPSYVYLSDMIHHRNNASRVRLTEIRFLRSPAGTFVMNTSVSAHAYRLLELADGESTISELATLGSLDPLDQGLIDELIRLWSQRLIELQPRC